MVGERGEKEERREMVRKRDKKDEIGARDGIFLEFEAELQPKYSPFESHSAIRAASRPGYHIFRVWRPIATKICAICEPGRNLG